MTKHKKILFLLKEKSYGSTAKGFTTGLLNSATFVVLFLRNHGYEAEVKVIKDSNSIDREVTQYNPDIVILEALWFTPEKIKEILSLTRHKHREWVVRIHSKAPFLANEGISIEWIREYTKLHLKNLWIAPNTLELTKQLAEVFSHGKFVYLPNVYFIKPCFPQEKYSLCSLDVGCFGAIRPMKNHFQQALAAIKVADSIGHSLNFHINASRVEQGGENVLKNLRSLFKGSHHNLVEHGWLDHSEFLSLISRMDFGSQVSFSESFNIVTADFVTAGIPIVTSDDIEWMPGILKASASDFDQIVFKMKLAYHFRSVLAAIQKHYLKSNINHAKSHWLDFVKKPNRKLEY